MKWTRESLAALLKEAAPQGAWDPAEPNQSTHISSLDVLVIVTRVFAISGIRISSESMKRENFRSLETVYRMLKEEEDK